LKREVKLRGVRPMVVTWVRHHCVKGNVRCYEKYEADDSVHGKEKNLIIAIEPKNVHSWCVVLL
jgi:hypothetical protein